MREIKFRGKLVEAPDKWIYGYYHFDPLEGACIMAGGLSYNVMPETVGQYIGLKDMNGVEIYEGDFLNTTHGIFPPDWPGLLLWDDTDYNVYRLFVDEEAGGWRLQWEYSLEDVYCYNGDVIVQGNIYDNPELREGIPLRFIIGLNQSGELWKKTC